MFVEVCDEVHDPPLYRHRRQRYFESRNVVSTNGRVTASCASSNHLLDERVQLNYRPQEAGKSPVGGTQYRETRGGNFTVKDRRYLRERAQVWADGADQHVA
jgi:hypothetical protein